MNSQEKIKKAIAKNLKCYRSNANLKQKDIANILNISQTKYSMVESGKAELTASEIVLACRFYNICTCMLYDTNFCK